MSLYALLPGGSDLAQNITKQHKTATVAPNNQRTWEEHAIRTETRLLTMNSSGIISRSDSLSSISIQSTTCNSSVTAVTKHEHQWLIRVEEAMLNFKNLASPPRKSGRAAVSRRNKNGDSRLRRRRSKEAYASSFDLDPMEKAVEFQFVVSFAGRTYCTKRTLLQIAQCRQNLLEEQAWAHQNFDSHGHCHIPDLPRVSNGHYCGGSFAQMNGMLDAYKSALEQWFQQVLGIVSDENPILSDFLWEPLDCTCNRDALHASLTKLGIIDEAGVWAGSF